MPSPTRCESHWHLHRELQMFKNVSGEVRNDINECDFPKSYNDIY